MRSAHYEAALKTGTALAEAHYNFGALPRDAGEDRTRPPTPIRKALAVNPQYASAWSGLGQLAEMDGRLAEAESSYRKAAEQAPADPLDPLQHRPHADRDGSGTVRPSPSSSRQSSVDHPDRARFLFGLSTAHVLAGDIADGRRYAVRGARPGEEPRSDGSGCRDRARPGEAAAVTVTDGHGSGPVIATAHAHGSWHGARRTAHRLIGACGLAASILVGRTDGTRPAAPLTAGPLFVDATEQSGLRFTHDNGATGQYYMPEMMGAGVALFDYDNDGDLDVYLIQGASIDPRHARQPGNRLFRNDGAGQRRAPLHRRDRAQPASA